jgi:hypothetical protein
MTEGSRRGNAAGEGVNAGHLEKAETATSGAQKSAAAHSDRAPEEDACSGKKLGASEPSINQTPVKRKKKTKAASLLSFSDELGGEDGDTEAGSAFGSISASTEQR